MKTNNHNQSNAVPTGQTANPGTVNCKGVTIGATVTLSGGLRGTVTRLLDGDSFEFTPCGRTEKMVMFLHHIQAVL